MNRENSNASKNPKLVKVIYIYLYTYIHTYKHTYIQILYSLETTLKEFYTNYIVFEKEQV